MISYTSHLGYVCVVGARSDHCSSCVDMGPTLCFVRTCLRTFRISGGRNWFLLRQDYADPPSRGFMFHYFMTRSPEKRSRALREKTGLDLPIHKARDISADPHSGRACGNNQCIALTHIAWMLKYIKPMLFNLPQACWAGPNISLVFGRSLGASWLRVVTPYPLGTQSGPLT